jgi:integrase
MGVLMLIPTVCRPGELRHMEWAELDREKRVRCIPGLKMKMRQPRIVPLIATSLALLDQLRPSGAKTR